MFRVHIVCHTAHMEKTYCFLLLKHYLVKFKNPKYFKRSYQKGTIHVCMYITDELHLRPMQGRRKRHSGAG